MKVTIDLKSLQNKDGFYNESDVNKVEELTGRKWSDIHQEAEKETKPDYPDGRPITWQRDTKLKFINENGRDEYERLIRERK